MNKEIISRFMNFVNPEPNTGCWLWSGAIDKSGYGVFRLEGKNKKAHRMSYHIFKEDIPEKLQVNHKCDVRCCVNPDHLWVGTQKENILDAVSKKRMAMQKVTHCPRGHELSGDNLILHKRRTRPNPGRECRICTNIMQKERRVGRAN